MTEEQDQHLWWYRAKVLRVIDGDTILLLIDKGMRDYSEESIRIAGYDAPELFSGDNREAGKLAKTWLENWVSSYASMSDWPLRMVTDKDKRSFNRYVAVIWTESNRSLNEDWHAAHTALAQQAVLTKSGDIK